jgi:MFS family permease
VALITPTQAVMTTDDPSKVLGPIIGGFVSESIGWRWTFWIITILVGRAQTPTAIILGWLIGRPRQEYHLPYQSSSSARPMPPCCLDGKLPVSENKPAMLLWFRRWIEA